MMDKVSPHFVYTVVALLLLGLIMVASSSSAIAEVYKGHVFAYFNQQLLFAVIGITIAMVATQTPLILWQKMAPYLLFIGIVGLLLVLLPGIGKEVNGSRRWIPLGSINIQTAEVIKLFIIIYIADYLYRHQVQFQRSFFKIFAPMILLSIPSILLLLQPDLGSVIVIGLTILLMLFLGGARISIVAIL
ncbi:MAG TPA: cell division protein FtsW, partial [Gammaproteobacteria bacterium]|nr:cell division protein FtsW [Gammaproteobacteria bacterium]